MLLTSVLLLFTTVISAKPLRELPTGRTTVQDVLNIHNAVLALDETVKNYQGAPFPTSLANGTVVLEGVAEIHRVNRQGFYNANLALPFTREDSNAVVRTVVETVNESIPTATENLKAKVAEFKESGFVSIVIASLGLLLYDHDSFSAAVFLKLRADQESTAQGAEAVAKIHNAIQDAIVFYTANLV